MKPSTLIACMATLATLQACQPAPMEAKPPVQRERLSYLKQTGSVPITCSVGTDCDTKWARALEWVTKHSVYSVRIATDSEIITNGPIEPTTDSAFTVTKQGGVINFSSSCGATPVCSPTALEVRSQFTNYVMYGVNG